MQVRRRIALAASRPGLLFATVFALIIATDQASKWAVRQAFHPGQSIDLIPGILLLTHVRNEGAAFGLMPGFRPLFIGTSLLVIAGIAIYIWRSRPQAIWLVVGLALAASGALGNLIDRVWIGRVTDFIDPQIFPVFNVADSAIVIGVGMLAFWILLDESHAAEENAVEAASEGSSKVAESSDADTAEERVADDMVAEPAEEPS